MEEWKEIPNTNGDYLVSNTGAVKSLKNHQERILKQRINKDGYIWYILQINGKAKSMRAHRLVAECFISNPLGKPTVNHIDGDKKNNSVENLEWANLNEQMIHAYRNGLKKPMRGVLQKRALLTEKQVKEIRTVYKSHNKNFGMIPLARKYNVSIATINRCVGKRSYKNVK